MFFSTNLTRVFFWQDTGISVRKRVIKILRDICLEQPGFHKITEMCVKMIRRVNDEEGIKVRLFVVISDSGIGFEKFTLNEKQIYSPLQKLVNETFQKLWFTPTPSHDQEAMNRKILNITDVVCIYLCICFFIYQFILPIFAQLRGLL